MNEKNKPVRKLSVREHSVLQTAVVLGLNVEYDAMNRATWDGDYLLPFRSHETLKDLVKSGLMERIGGHFYGQHFRATEAGKRYACRANGCTKGRIYRQTDGAWDEEVGKCAVCSGTGLLRSLAPLGTTPP
jgi:hypothetical protein